MTEETILMYFFIILFVVIFFVSAVQTSIRQKKQFIMKIRNNWGKAPDREYTYEEFKSISHYAKLHKKDAFQIDDITWNDLDMDKLFLMINNTISSCGEEYLYYILREPTFSQDVLDERNRLIEFFRENEEVRIKVQRLLGQIGKTRGVSLYEYICRLKEIERKSNLKYYLLILGVFVGIVSFFINPFFGLLYMIGLLIINTSVYVNEKVKMEMYLNCFRCILNMASVVTSLEKENIPEIQSYTRELVKAKKGLAGFTRGSFLVMSNGTVAGDIGTVILESLKMLFHIDKIKYNSMLKQLDGHEEDVEALMKNWGILDSAIAIASFREYLPYYTRGEFSERRVAEAAENEAIRNYESTESENRLSMEVKNLYHPLLDAPVANSISVKGGILITGSNASGKSTFIKTVAINSLLAQTIDTAVATKYKSSFLKVMTSMALNDNLEQGESYYIVEIKSLKRILDESKKNEPMLCVIDEVLRGTNTIERIAASSQILKELGENGNVLSFAATHDLELSYMLEPLYTNYHFEEELSDYDVRFSYVLKDGRTNTRNAIRLLKIMGYEDSIVESASEQAACFENTGEWKLC